MSVRSEHVGMMWETCGQLNLDLSTTTTIIHRHGDLGTAVVASLEAVGWQYLLRDNRLPVYRAGSQGLRLNELDIYQRPPTGTLPCTVDALHPVKMTGSFIRYSFELLPLSKRASSSSRGLFTRSSASLCLFTPSYPAGGGVAEAGDSQRSAQLNNLGVHVGHIRRDSPHRAASQLDSFASRRQRV